MQRFSDYLEDYMKANSIAISDLARETEIDRTVIYRYVKGTRIPSGEDIVLKLADALQMSVKERNRLIEEYDKLIYGDTLVYSYYYVKELLEELKQKSEEPDQPGRQWETVRELAVQTPVVCLNSREDITACILDLFEMIARKPEIAEKIQILMQPTYASIQNDLLNIFQETDVQLEQLVCMEQNISRGYENLKIFQQLLPLCVGLKNYDVYYYYDALSSHLNDMSHMPNLILAGEYAVQFDYKMSQGMLIRDPAYVRGMHFQYKKMLAMSDRLIDKGKSIQKFDEFNRQFIFYEGGSFFRQLCMAACLDREILETHIYPMPGKEEFICGLMEKYGGWQDGIHTMPDQNMKIVWIISGDGGFRRNRNH